MTLNMLTGAELLSTVKSLEGASKSELVRACGYVVTKSDGTEKLCFTQFYEALLEAKGLPLTQRQSGKGPGGRALSFVTKAQFNGNILIGKAYTAQLGIEPGDRFEIRLSKSGIRLVPMDADLEFDGEAGDGEDTSADADAFIEEEAEEEELVAVAA